MGRAPHAGLGNGGGPAHGAALGDGGGARRGCADARSNLLALRSSALLLRELLLLQDGLRLLAQAQGMVYLHGRRIMHRDLKTANLLIDGTRSVKLADFGLALVKQTSLSRTTATVRSCIPPTVPPACARLARSALTCLSVSRVEVSRTRVRPSAECAVPTHMAAAFPNRRPARSPTRRPRSLATATTATESAATGLVAPPFL